MADQQNYIIDTSFKAWKKQKLPFVRTKYKSTRNSLTKILKSARRDFFRNLDTSDQKLFWKTVNQLTHHSSSVPVLTHDTGRASTSQEKADVLSEFFKKCFNNSIPSLSFSDLDVFVADSNCCPDEFLITTEEVEYLLVTLDTNKSSQKC